MSNRFDSFLREHGTISQFSASSTPLKNGVMERRNQTVMDIVRSMMSFSSLLIFFFGIYLWDCVLPPLPKRYQFVGYSKGSQGWLLL